MSVVTRTITTTMNPQDTVAQAEAVAANLRSSGYDNVTIGRVYDNVTVRWYGMPSIDITYTVPDGPAPEAPAEAPVDDAPEPMPLAELGGSPTPPERPPGPESSVGSLTEDNVFGNISDRGEEQPAEQPASEQAEPPASDAADPKEPDGRA